MYSNETKRKVLAALPGTQAEIQAKAGIAHSTARAVLKMLIQEAKCHIGGRQRSFRKSVRVYCAGAGDEIPKPRPAPAPGKIRRDPLVAALFGEVVA